MSERESRNLEIDSGWLVERDPLGGDFYDGHMLPGSDCTPLVDLSTLPGWMMFSEEAIERAAEALWLHRPMERIAGGEPKPFRDLKPYQRLRYLGMARAVVAALRGEA